MRSTIIAAAFAAGAIAVPYQKRDVVVQTETAMNVVYVTDVVTVTQGSAQTSTVEAQAAPTTKQQAQWGGNSHWGHHWGWNWGSSKQTTKETEEAPAPTSTTEAAPTTEAPAPTTTWAPETTTQAAAPPPAYTSKPSTTAAASQPTGTVSGYKDITLYHHNIHRANHSASDLEWDDNLEASAAQIAASCIYAHNVDVMGGGYGQNIAAGVEPNNISAVITDLFYNGEEPLFAADNNYGLADPNMSNFEGWGHFSQIVWKGTTHVACVTQDCSNAPKGLQNVASNVAPYFTVCNYKGPGNYAGEYADNIGRPKGEPTCQWNTGL